MKSRLRKNFFQKLSHNIGLKLLALVLAAVLWFIVTNITDPIDSKPFKNIQVEIINEQALLDEGKVYSILENTAVISSIEVTGKSSILDKISREDIKAVADLSEITFLNTVNIKISSSRNNADLSFKPSNNTLKLSVEDVKRTQMVINSSVIGSPAEGYIVGNVTPSQNVVRISGPQSIVDKIDRVDAVANIGNYAYTSDINTSVDLVLYDAEGMEISKDQLKLNISTINITVSILATKEVPLKFEVYGEPADGYKAISGAESSVETIKIAGKKSVLDSINTITISDPSVDITDATGIYTTSLNIKKQLPSGVTIADNTFDGNVTVVVPIEKIVTRRYDVPVSNFAVGHVPEGFEAEIIDIEGLENYGIMITGINSDLINLKARDIIAVVDMDLIASEFSIEEWDEGEYIGTVHFNLSDEKYTTTQKYTMTVKLTSLTD